MYGAETVLNVEQKYGVVCCST